MFKERFFVRNLESPSLLENFLISAVVSVVGIRYYLFLTNYPQIGGGGLHIAHMLWGGLLMLIAIVLLLTFLNKSVFQISAVIGGLGFGTFIDELGKFITSDNNYFFQPTIALIYIVFVLIYLSSKAITRYKQYSSNEYLINSIEALKEAVIDDLDEDEKKKALGYLEKSNLENPLSKVLQHTLAEIKSINSGKPNILLRYLHSVNNFYKNIIQKNWFSKVVISVFLLEFIGTIIQSIIFIGGVTIIFFPNLIPYETFSLETNEMLNLAFSLLSGILVIIGVIYFRFSRLKAYTFFKRSVLISIFLIQVFAFYENQLSAIFGLFIDLTLLLALNYMISREEAKNSIYLEPKV